MNRYSVSAKIKGLIWISLPLIVLAGLGRLYFVKTDGFREANIVEKLPYREDFNLRPLSIEEQVDADEALSQPYFYLDKGHQAYAFISEDQKYVIKFLKFQRMRAHPWYADIPLPLSWDQNRQKKFAYKKQMVENLFQSWKLAYEKLQDEAAIVYVHINKTTIFNKKLTIYDKIGMRHDIDLDNTIYLVQRKVEMLRPTVDALIVEGQVEKAKLLLDRIVDLFISEYKRGLAETDHHVIRNMGFINGIPKHVDNGRFEEDEEMKNPRKYSLELVRKTAELQKWLSKKHPELAGYLKDRVETVRKESDQ